MRLSRQLVCLTMAVDAPGFPAILINLLTRLGYRWYPEYTVYEDFRNFNQEQYQAVVVIWDRRDRSITELHTYCGVGVAVDMAVHDATFTAITCLHREHPCLEETGFRYIPYVPTGDETGSDSAAFTHLVRQRNDRSYTAVCTPYVSHHYDP